VRRPTRTTIIALIAALVTGQRIDGHADERALRRYKQLKEKGLTANLAALSLEIAERDRRDMNRAVAPLVAAPDAVSIDTTGMPIEAVVERILAIVRERLLI